MFPALAEDKADAGSNGPGLSNLYFGQKPPGKKAAQFAPDVITYETHDSPIIAQDETWLVAFGFGEGGFYTMVDGNLVKAANPLGFDVPEPCNGMAISLTESRVYFLMWEDGDENFYYTEETEGQWTDRRSLGDEINSVNTHWQFSVDRDENLYCMDREQGIVVSVFDGETHLKPVPLKLEDGSNMPGGTPFIAPDGSYLLLSWQEDLFISYNLNNGTWTTPQNLGPDINSDALDLCPRISPNGKYLFFVSRRVGRAFVTYWADAGFVEDLKPKNR
jgi:hypothetical protein